jgi:peptide/nickel transport system permease protein
LKEIIHSPLAVVGIIVFIFPIILSTFPELISEVSFEAANGIYTGAWNPPSPEHLLGQTEFGRDVFARILYGARDSVLFGFGAALIGLIGGLIFGLLASKFTRVIPTLTRIVMLVFYILPAIILVMLAVMLGGQLLGILVIVTGLLLIPSFTKVIANTEFRVVPIGKKIISYVPLFAGFAILLYAALGFLGFTDPRLIQLGNEISQARVHLYDAPWATLWPGITIFLIVGCLFLLHEGLAQHSR